jgi:hypothetical protein
MHNRCFRSKAVKLAVISLLAISSVVVTESAFAQYRHQVAQICQDKVKTKGLKGDAWKAEYQKCKLDPINYK